MTDALTDWPGAPGRARLRMAGAPSWQAGFKASPEAFRVDEDLGFEPAGTGNHWLLRLEKRDMTTGALVDRVAAITGTKPRDIGLCGLKDRQAVTSQWLSVPHETFDPAAFEAACAAEGIGLLAMDRHDKKLRRGIHRANRFRLVLHDVAPRPGEDAPALAEYLAERRERLASRGFANYFGEQRYGRGFSNLEALREWGQGERRGSPKRAARNWLLSTLRSAIFDRVLADRLEQATIATVLEGDVLRLAGSRSRFVAEADEIDALQRRLDAGDLSLTGPLWGETGTQAVAAVGERETALADAMLERWGRESWQRRLVQWRVEPDRRPLTIPVADLAFEVGEGTVTLSFSLPPGSYATELVAELFAPPA
ncbi:MAG: tRNA pseudouridine(13) synthase TruD [Halanaeroarchaeum sp.]